jgi:hypothetical protein
MKERLARAAFDAETKRMEEAPGITVQEVPMYVPTVTVRVTVPSVTDDWTWAMWLGFAYAQADCKRAWEAVSMERAREWVGKRRTPYTEDEFVEFLEYELPGMLKGKRYVFTMSGCRL